MSRVCITTSPSSSFSLKRQFEPKKRLGRKSKQWEYLTIIIMKRWARVIVDRRQRKRDTRNEGFRVFASFKRRVRGQLVHDK